MKSLAWRVGRKIGGWIAFCFILHATLFVLFDLLPDSAARHLGWAALSTELLNRTRERMGLAASPGKRYYNHLWNLVHGRLGNSMLTGVPVTGLISNALMRSAGIWCIGILAITLAPTIAVYMIIRPRPIAIERLLRIAARVGIAPQLIIAALAFALYAAVAGKLSAQHAYTVRFVFASISTAAYPGALAYLIAADIAVGLQQSQFVRTYLAMGLSWPRIRLLLLKNIGSELVPYSPRLAIGMLLSSGLTEFVFSINGFGLLFFRSLRAGDLSVMFGCALVIGIGVAILSTFERRVGTV